MTGRNIALTGVPRGGTTLSCHLLDACADTVALFEPMDVTALDETPAGALDQVDAFFSQSRHSLLTAGTAPSKHRGGTVPDNPFGERDPDGRRRLQVDHGQIAPGRPAEGFTLVVKHNAAFCALLPDLATRFDTLAIVRNPLAVLASWNTVDLPVSQGRIPAGERLDQALRQRLDAEPDRLARQLIVLAWFFEQFQLQLAPSRVLRYEDIVATGGDALRRAAGLQGAPRRDLALRNSSALYRDTQISPLVDALHRYDDAPWSTWYDHAAISVLAADLGVATA